MDLDATRAALHAHRQLCDGLDTLMGRVQDLADRQQDLEQQLLAVRLERNLAETALLQAHELLRMLNTHDQIVGTADASPEASVAEAVNDVVPQGPTSSSAEILIELAAPESQGEGAGVYALAPLPGTADDIPLRDGEKRCEFCRKPFRPRPQKQRFCSRWCSANFRFRDGAPPNAVRPAVDMPVDAFAGLPERQQPSHLPPTPLPERRCSRCCHRYRPSHAKDYYCARCAPSAGKPRMSVAAAIALNELTGGV